MSTIQVCDVCGKTTDIRQRQSYIYDRGLDAAGSNSDRVETFDLCSNCELEALRVILKVLKKSGKIDEFEFNKDLIKFIKNLINHNELERKNK